MDNKNNYENITEILKSNINRICAFAAVIIYGGIMNPAAALMYNSQSVNWEMLKAYYVSGLPMDLIHAAATVIFIMIAAEPMLEKLDRIKIKYGLVE